MAVLVREGERRSRTTGLEHDRILEPKVSGRRVGLPGEHGSGAGGADQVGPGQEEPPLLAPDPAADANPGDSGAGVGRDPQGQGLVHCF